MLSAPMRNDAELNALTVIRRTYPSTYGSGHSWTGRFWCMFCW